jgi:hypothetical protein
MAALHHLTDDQVVQTVREAARVCKPSGRIHIIDAILPVTPNFTVKRTVFNADRGEHPREHDQLLGLIGKAGRIETSEILAGPFHDVTYIGVSGFAQTSGETLGSPYPKLRKRNSLQPCPPPHVRSCSRVKPRSRR